HYGSIVSGEFYSGYIGDFIIGFNRFMVDNLKKPEMLKYFMSGYFNQSVSWSDLEGLATDFKEREPKSMVKQLISELKMLQDVLQKGDKETWREIEKYVHEYSMRYLDFEDGPEFINTVLKAIQ
ncbi:contact-dependent growth inhibition system immunity protein, partial [Geobacillus stearothermophilus]